MLITSSHEGTVWRIFDKHHRLFVKGCPPWRHHRSQLCVYIADSQPSVIHHQQQWSWPKSAPFTLDNKSNKQLQKKKKKKKLKCCCNIWDSSLILSLCSYSFSLSFWSSCQYLYFFNCLVNCPKNGCSNNIPLKFYLTYLGWPKPTITLYPNRK